MTTQNGGTPPREIEATLVAQEEPSGLMAMTAGETLSQINAARRFPRDIERFRRTALAYACIDEDTAAGCFYAVPRAGKTIEGPSIRMAEILATCWGNLRIRTRLVERTAKAVVVSGEVWDVETNSAWSAEESGRITGRDGRTYSEDMVQTTIKATAAKARRNAILMAIPAALYKGILSQARRVAVGNAATLAQSRSRALEALQKMGATQDRVLYALGRASVALIDLDDILVLRSHFQSIKEGERTVDDLFPEPPDEEAEKKDAAKKARAKAKAKAKPKSKAKAKAKAEEPKPEEEKAEPSDDVLSGLRATFAALKMSNPGVAIALLGDLGDAPLSSISAEDLRRGIAAMKSGGME